MKRESFTRRDSITVQTRAGDSIENFQGGMIDAGGRMCWEAMKRDYRSAKFRTGPIPIYNCHGLTFASRRTAIDKLGELSKILRDDRYMEITNLNRVLPGDIILYIDKQTGDREHSGIVVSEPKKTLGVPFVVSKWGMFGEVLHLAMDCPYHEECMVKYYRVIE